MRFHRRISWISRTSIEGTSRTGEMDMCKRFRKTMFSFELLLIELRFAVAVCTMTTERCRLALSRLCNGTWTIQTRNWTGQYAVQSHLVRTTLIQIPPPNSPMKLRSTLFKGSRHDLSMTSVATMILVF